MEFIKVLLQESEKMHLEARTYDEGTDDGEIVGWKKLKDFIQYPDDYANLDDLKEIIPTPMHPSDHSRLPEVRSKLSLFSPPLAKNTSSDPSQIRFPPILSNGYDKRNGTG
eukprot:TRINITY_DN3023_c0_g1_i1.p2 TRINITY_DN3023_c0_g1~~TRINITY_DN3023_c0_g1_i1.p2  ORF type:complete len:111 (-),score=30.07 TRINITY_DN3023_c0_g1_i1:57-389(-)